MTTTTGAGVFDAGPDDERHLRDLGYDDEEIRRLLGGDTQQAWIAAAEADVRDTAKEYALVPPDHPARAWDKPAADFVDGVGSGLARSARTGANAKLRTAQDDKDWESETVITSWLKTFNLTTTGPKRGTKSPARWLAAAQLVHEALAAWLPEDVLTEGQQADLAKLIDLKRQRVDAVEEAFNAAVEEAIAEEKSRREADGAWEDELARRAKDTEDVAAAEQARQAAAMSHDLLLSTLKAPEQFRVCEPYEIDRDGVWSVRMSEQGGVQRSRIATAPMIVMRVFTDPDGEQLVELAWRDGPQVVTRTVPRVVAKSGRLLVKMLGNAGIPIVEADARAVERYLAAIEADNRACIPREPIARQLGWQPDGTFLAAPESDRRIEVAFEEQRRTLAAHHQRGALADWQTAIKGIETYPIPRIMLAGAFAAPLLRILEIDSFTIDLSGRSTGGKTISAMIALSVWACPTTKGGALSTWRTTLLKAEMRLNLCNGVVAVLDETRAVKEEGLVDKVLYQVPMNHGTSRGGGYPSDLPWSTILVSTGEQPALSFTTHEGASARVLSLRGAPFGRDGESSATAAAAVRDAVSEVYGTAGPAFAARLVEQLANPGYAEVLRKRHEALAAQHRNGTDVTRRRAAPIAALRLAAELAHEWNICPLPPLKAKQWTDLLSVEQQRDDRGAMALDVAREFVARQGHRMWSAHVGPNDTPAIGWIGAYLDLKDKDSGVTRSTVALLPEVLGEELARRGYRIDAVRQAWVDSKLITLEAGGELIRRRVPNRVRVYEFERDVFDDKEEDESGTNNKKQDPVTCPTCGWPVDSEGHVGQCEASRA